MKAIELYIKYGSFTIITVGLQTIHRNNKTSL